MKTKARSDSIRKRKKIEEKYSWDRLSNSRDERRSHKARALFASFFVLFIFIIYMIKLYEVQVSNYSYYSLKSDSNRIKIRPIQADRGLILDRNGVKLAENISTFNLIVKKEKISDRKIFFEKLKQVIPLNPNQVNEIKLQFKNNRLKDITILENISLEKFSEISVDQHILPDLELISKFKRNYIYPEAMSHVIGYLGKVSDSDIESDVVTIQEGMTEIGKIGIERFYQNILSGKPGYEKLETDAQGKIIRVIESIKPSSGNDIFLTIDSELQNFAYNQFKNKEGAAIVMNIKNGDILSLVSAPGYDINLFANSITQKKYSKLLSRDDKPLINRALAGQYPPGSTLKPFIGLVALNESIIDADKIVSCSGAYHLPNHKRPFRCWKRDGHGTTNLSYGLAQSCDVFFYRVAELTGIDTISEKLYKYGFGERTYIDLYGEAKGLVPDRLWKSKTQQLPWYPGETLNVGIGQGYFLATPIQLTLGTALLASEGKTYIPHLLLGSMNKKTKELKKYNHLENTFSAQIGNPEYLDIVQHAMWRVINEKGVGTAAHLQKVKGIEIAGKTGTAQVYSLDAGRSTKKKLQDHALFISYAPFNNPEIVVTVIIEHGGSGSTAAAPVARNIINFYNKKQTQLTKK